MDIKEIYRTFGIYRITNKENGHTYIGKTGVSFGDRWDCHRAQLNGGYHDNPGLQAEWNEYGKDAFEFCVVETTTDKSSLNDLERLYIAEYRKNGVCYNIGDGGDESWLKGSHVGDEAKKKIGEKNRINMTGRKLSEEVRAKMSESQKIRNSNMTSEEKAAISERLSQVNKGRKWSDDSKNRFSDKQKTCPNGATLTLDAVREIRRLHEECGKTTSEISKILGIPIHNVYMIATYRRWANA